ncbi:MAG: Cys-tRNA(Pro) deacylase [Oscillospiraceae bacterium]|nr:Cys-tRNA(Pro) deacylase [Oscillospiraceae bacterium]
MNKTNAMRRLDSAKLKYRIQEYTVDENDLSGLHVAEQIGQDPSAVFKTIVVRGEKRGIVVLCIPVDREIDLKKAAKAVGDKRLEPVHVKELLGLTGYIRGGCSPIGMKKKYPTYFHSSARELTEIAVSAGVRGAQIIMAPAELIDFVDAEAADLCVGDDQA